MKATHTLYLLFITLLCVAGFTACDDSGSDDMIWDFAPIELHIAVQDLSLIHIYILPLRKGRTRFYAYAA